MSDKCTICGAELTKESIHIHLDSIGQSLMSEQRNAERDREIIAGLIEEGWANGGHRAALHYLERADAAEQRVADLTKYLECIEEELEAWVDANRAKVIIQTFLKQALKGGTE